MTRSLRFTEHTCSGVVYVEYLIALLPVLCAALSVWQLLELWMGELLVSHAASVAVRAAAVVLPDDPGYYGGVPPHQYEGQRKSDIELSVVLVLSGSAQFVRKPIVTLRWSPSGDTVTARVSVEYECSMGRLSFVCHGSRQLIEAEASYPYQGARYRYSSR